MKLLDLVLGPQHQQQATEQRRAEIYKALIHYEAKIGGKLFGSVPEGTRREFFCLDEHTWVWHEEWADAEDKHVTTTRYDVRPNGVFKSQGSSSYQALSPEEARNFHDAVMMYYEQVAPELNRLQQIS